MTETKLAKTVMRLIAALFGLALVTGAHAGDMPVRALTDLNWDQRAPVIAVAPIWHDAEKDIYGMYVRINAGATVPHHTHTFDYHGVVLQGNWVHYYGADLGEGHAMTTGDYGYQAGKEVHTDGCAGPEDCIFYIVLLGKPDNIPFVEE